MCFAHDSHKSRGLNLADGFPVHRIRAVSMNFIYAGRIGNPPIPAVRTPLFRFGERTGKKDEMTAGT